MKVGELYYGISIPQSEFRRVEAQLKRFEQAMKQAGGREAAAAIRQTATAATEASQRIGELSRAWTVLNERYVAGKIGSQEFVSMSRSIVNQLESEMSMLDSTSKEYADFAAMKTRVARAEQAESNRISKTVREQAVARNEVTYANSRYAESSRMLISELNREAAQLARIDAAQKSGTITKEQALQQYSRLLAALQALRTRFEQANIAADQQTKAFQRIDRSTSQTSNRIERLRLQTQGYNTASLEGIKLSDSLTKAWLIGLGPQGYRLYLVMDVLKSTMFGLNASVAGSIGAFAKLGVILKATGIGTLLVAIGTAIAGLNQMLTLEDTMADVRKTTGLTAEQLAVLEQAFRSLSLQLPSTTNELAEIAVQAGQLGVRGQRNIFEFTRAIAELKLAVTGLGEDAAITMGRFLNVIGTPILEFGDRAREVAGILNELENNTAATAGEILDMAQSMAFLNAIAGVSMRDILGMSAGLKAMGVNVELAGTNARKVFFSLVKDIARGSDAVDRWAAAAGMMRDDFVELARSENGFSQALTRVALNLGRAGLSAEEMTAALSNLGFVNQREIQVILALAQGHQTFQHAMELANDETQTAVSVQNELAIRLDVTRVRLQLVRNRLAAMVQVIGIELLPMLGDSVLWFERNSEALGQYGAAFLALVDLIRGVAQFALGMAKFIAAPFIAVFFYIQETMKIANTLLEPIRALNEVMSMDDASYTDIIRGSLDAVRALQGVRDMLSKYDPDAFGGQIMGGLVKERIDEMFRGIQDNDWMGALESFTNALAKWDERAANITGRMPVLIDMVDDLHARAKAMGAVDPDLLSMLDEEAAKKTGRTVQDVISNLGVALIAVQEYGAYMESQGLKYDVPLEQNNLMMAALRELVFTFGQTAKSPEAAGIIAMLEEQGINAREALKYFREYKEWLTTNWIRKSDTMLEAGMLLPEDMLLEATQAVSKLQTELWGLLNPPEGEGRDWEEIWSLEARIKEAKEFRDRLRELTTPEMLGVRLSRGRDEFDAREEEVSEGDKARDEQWQADTLAMAEAQDTWNARFRMGTQDVEEFHDALTVLARSTLPAVASGAQAMLDALPERFFPEMFGDEMLPEPPESIYKTFERLGEAREELIQQQRALNRVTTEAENPLGHMYTWLVKLAQGTGLAADAAKRALDDFRELFRVFDGSAPMVGIPDDLDLGLAGFGEDYQKTVQELTDVMLNDFNRVFAASSTPVAELHRNLTALANSSMPAVAAFARGLLRDFDTTFVEGFDRAIKQARTMSSVLADTFLPGMLKPFETELSLLGDELKINLDKLVAFREVYGAGSVEVQALQAVILGLRVRIEELTQAQADEIAMQERWVQARKDAAAVVANQEQMLAAAIRAITEATGPQLTQTQQMIQQYEDLLPLLGRFAGFLGPYLQMLRDRNAVEGGEALAAVQAQIAQAAGVTEDKFLKFIPVLKALTIQYPHLAAEIRAVVRSLHELSEAASRTEVEDKLDAMADRAAQFAGTAPTAIEAFIEELLKMADATKETFPDLSARFSQLANDMAVFDDATQKLKVEEQLTEMANRAAQFAGTAPTAIEAFIEELLKMADAAKDTFPELSDGFLRLASDMMVFDDATRQMEFDKALKGIQEQMDALQGKSKNPFDAFIDNLEESREKFKALGIDIDDFIPKLEALSAAFEKATKLDKSADDLELYLGIAETLFDLFQDGNWTDGNKLLDAVTEIGSTLVGLIPVIGPALSRIVSMVGQFINKIIGDMSSGIRQVQKQIDDVASRSRYLHRDLVEDLTATKQVSRGGLLGWLGFTKTAVDQELTDLRIGIAESFGSALSAGIMAALSGDTDWKTKLRDGIAAAISQALLDAFIQTALLTAGLADFVNDFTRILIEDGASAAAAYASQHMGRLVDTLAAGAEIIIGALAPFAPTPPPPEDFDDFGTTGTHGYFTLPTATPGIITATPAWVDNLGMHFAKFGMYVDRLVDEGILVNCSGGSGPSGGVKARDLRLAR